MRLEECFEKRLLRKIKPDMKKAKKSLETSKKKLEEAKKALKLRLFNSCMIMAYTAMFHAARSLLYKDGIQEKSHVCAIIYLKQKYMKELSATLINALNVHRIERHEALYGIEFVVTEDDCRIAIEDAEDLIKRVERLLGSNL